MKIDIKETDIPNICFSTADIDDRACKHQRLTRGFDDSETIELFYTIACFILPRLARFIALDEGFLYSRDKDQINKIKNLYNSLKLIIRNKAIPLTDAEVTKVKKGIQGFPDIFFTLWR